MNPTTIHASEIVGQFVLIEDDPIRQRVKHAIGGFLAGYSGTTLEAYRLDLRGWITWLDAAFLASIHRLGFGERPPGGAGGGVAERG